MHRFVIATMRIARGASFYIFIVFRGSGVRKNSFRKNVIISMALGRSHANFVYAPYMYTTRRADTQRRATRRDALLHHDTTRHVVGFM